MKVGTIIEPRLPDAVDFAVAAERIVSRGDRLEHPGEARRHADGYAFTIGAMGTNGRNFYNEAFTRLGYGAEVSRVAELWRAGKRDEARRAVPIDLGRLTNRVDTPDGMAARVRKYADAGITTLLAKLEGESQAQLATLGRLLDIVAAV